MADVQQIAYNGVNAGGQVLYIDAPEGRPSSVTSVTVFQWNGSDEGSPETATTGSGTVETTPNTTFNAPSGIATGATTKMNLTSLTGIVIGRQYLITDSDSRKEWVEVAALDTGGSDAYAKSSIFGAYESPNPFVSTRITIAFDATWVADDTNITDGLPGGFPGYRVRWIYVVGGITIVRYTYFDLVRTIGDHNVRPPDLELLVPGYLSHMPLEHRIDQGKGLIDEAYRQLKVDLQAVGVADQLLRNQDTVDELVKHRAILLWAEGRALTGGDSTTVELARDRYMMRWNMLVRDATTAKVPIATDSGGAGRKVFAETITRR
jgi:hypothetical protein